MKSEHPIVIHDCVHPMGDSQHRKALELLPDGLLVQLIGPVVHISGGLVHY